MKNKDSFELSLTFFISIVSTTTQWTIWKT